MNSSIVSEQFSANTILWFAKLEEIVTYNGVWYSAIATITSWLLYWVFWKPFDKFTDFTSIGYESVTSRSNKRETTKLAKRNAINELNKRKNAGALPPVYPNGWFTILESHELAVKTSKEVYALGLNLVAWRGDSGVPYVADAYCPHLGAHLGVGGTVSGECIKCPFHGWAFEGSKGELVDIPYASCDTVAKFSKLKMWPIVECNGHIFLWHHAEGEEPKWRPEPLPEIHSGEYRYRGRSEHRVANHIQDLSENGADVAHLSVLHRPIVLEGNDPETAFLKWNFFHHCWVAKWEPNLTPGKSHEALGMLHHTTSLLGISFKLFDVTVKIIQTGPGFNILSFGTIFGTGIFIQTMTPIGPLLQKVTHRFYSPKMFIHPIARIFIIMEAAQYERDIRIWNRKTFPAKPVLTKEEKALKSFRNWYSQFYTDNSPTYQSCKESPNHIDF